MGCQLTVSSSALSDFTKTKPPFCILLSVSVLLLDILMKVLSPTLQVKSTVDKSKDLPWVSTMNNVEKS